MKNNKKIPFTIAQKTLQNVLEKIADEDFRNDFKQIKKRIENNKTTEKKEDKSKNFFSELNEIQKLRIKYKLSEPHSVALAWILFMENETENIDGLFRNNHYEIITNKYGEKILHIPIYPETTIEDIREIFPSIKKEAKSLYGEEKYGRLRRKPKLDRNLTAHNLKLLGYNNKEINNFFKESLKFKHENIIIADIPKMVNRIKKSQKKGKKTLSPKKS